MQFRDIQYSQWLLSFLTELAALRVFAQTVISQGDVNQVHFACPSIFFVSHLREPAVNSAKAGRGLTERGAAGVGSLYLGRCKPIRLDRWHPQTSADACGGGLGMRGRRRWQYIWEHGGDGAAHQASRMAGTV